MKNNNKENSFVKPLLYQEDRLLKERPNQNVFYSPTRVDHIEYQMKTILENSEKMSNRLVRQEQKTHSLQVLNEHVQTMLKQKHNVLNELMMKLNEYVLEKDMTVKQLNELEQTNLEIAARLDEYENNKDDLYEQLTEYNENLQSHDQLMKSVRKEQLNQKEQLEELVQQLQLREIDHDDLFEKVKDNETEHNQVEEQMNELIETIARLTSAHRNQEQLHLELYTEFLEFKDYIDGDMERHTSKVNSELEQLKIDRAQQEI
ncbi:hypothetical protein [Bacillus suaedae]|uniref:Uncharacterized protein n=1 Tax=Halalkalibacter suaedae TaxID=2822140 RepID=A0A941AQB6_9BACI|nr:hypothetical protein [Bacillus suaedae]MBP3950983.1 hypothetical protein [Bacillus suaedae]